MDRSHKLAPNQGKNSNAWINERASTPNQQTNEGMIKPTNEQTNACSNAIGEIMIWTWGGCYLSQGETAQV